MPVILENIACWIKNERDPLRSVILNIDSLRINKGEFVGIIDTGTGEASALGRIICGLAMPDAGSVLNTETDGGAKAAAFFDTEAEKAVSERTVEKEVCVLLKKTGKSKQELESAAKDAIELVGLDYEAVRHRSPFELTKAERRSVSLASLLAVLPKLIVLDEPMRDMDGVWCARLMELLKKLNGDGVTVILITADTSRLSEYASRIIIMKDGSPVLDSSAKNVFSEFFFLNHLGVDVPDVKKCCQMLRENGMDMPTNIILYEQFLDRLKILMWRKNK